jgi:predicted small lipoprotein YifL
LKLGVAVSPADRKIVSRVLVAGIAVLAIGLTGCGRKAALDPPPGAAVTTTTSCTTCAPAPAPKGPDKPFFLDWLL